MIKKKARLLMQLCDSMSGYTGITQETQLLFSSLLDSSTFQPDGLIVKQGNYDLRKISRGVSAKRLTSSHRNIKHLSDFIISYKTDNARNKSMPGPLDLLFLPLTLLYLNCLSHLGFSVPIDHFNQQGFENFIWDYFFASTLTATEFKKVTSAHFRSINYPINLMHIAGCISACYPKLNTQDYDIFLAQTPFPGRVKKNTQLVVRYHDAIPIFAPHLMLKPKFQQTFHYNALKSNAKHGLFACVSHAARNDLLCLFPSLEKRSVVIHDLVSDHFFEERNSRHSLNDIILSRTIQADKNALFLNKELSKPFKYLLMVSRIEPRKNHIRAMRAWEMIRHSLDSNLKLIFIGKIDHDLGCMDAMKLWQERGELFHLHNVPLSELRFLYREAACVICPSLMEGFDLSGIEAMLCGGKVAASNIPVHHEVYGHAAVYFDPYSIEAQASAIESIILPENSQFSTELISTGLSWAKRYQKKAIIPLWENFFEEVQTGKFKL